MGVCIQETKMTEGVALVPNITFFLSFDTTKPLVRGNLFTFLSRPTYISIFLSKFAENVRPEDAKWITSADSSRVYPTDDSELTTKSPLI